MISPTGSNQIRNDKMGGGSYGTPRRGHTHRGTDYICSPGADIVAPISGKITRYTDPYGDKQYAGVEIKGHRCTVKIFYLDPSVDVGAFVKMGQVIGTAQDISKRWGDEMKPHIHLEITEIDPDLFVEMLS